MSKHQFYFIVALLFLIASYLSPAWAVGILTGLSGYHAGLSVFWLFRED